MVFCNSLKSVCVLALTFILLVTGLNSSLFNTSSDAVRELSQEKVSKYVPSPVEEFFVEYATALGWNSPNNPKTCDVWKSLTNTEAEVYNGLKAYASDLGRYQTLMSNKVLSGNETGKFNLVKEMIRLEKEGRGDTRDELCARLRLHPDGLRGVFPSGQLSLTKSGYVEPLTPPMRFHEFCFNNRKLMSLEYLVHDWEVMCLNLKQTSKLVLIDMGAALDFHGGSNQPIVALMRQYEKFGFVFDHIYGFEITPTASADVFGRLLPVEYFPAYHWINVGVNAEEGHNLNPLHSILQSFSEDDYIVVKLDIDTAAVELPLAHQILGGGPDGVYHRLIDQFYFEHHVHLGDLAPYWGASMNGTIKDSLDLFYGLREKGIPSHFWP